MMSIPAFWTSLIKKTSSFVWKLFPEIVIMRVPEFCDSEPKNPRIFHVTEGKVEVYWKSLLKPLLHILQYYGINRDYIQSVIESQLLHPLMMERIFQENPLPVSLLSISRIEVDNITSDRRQTSMQPIPIRAPIQSQTCTEWAACALNRLAQMGGWVLGFEYRVIAAGCKLNKWWQ